MQLGTSSLLSTLPQYIPVRTEKPGLSKEAFRQETKLVHNFSLTNQSLLEVAWFTQDGAWPASNLTGADMGLESAVHGDRRETRNPPRLTASHMDRINASEIRRPAESVKSRAIDAQNAIYT